MHLTKSKIFLILASSFIIGVFFANFYDLNYEFYIFITLFLIFVFSLIFRNIIFLVASLSLIISFGGFLYFDSYIEKTIPNNIPYDKIVEFDGIVNDYPDERQDTTKYILKVTKSVEQNLIGENILIDLPKYPQYKYADSLHIVGKIEKPTNFQEFDYQMFLARYNIFALVKYNEYDDKAVMVEKTTPQENIQIKSLIFDFRSKIYTNFKKIFPQPESGILSAIILGLKRAIPTDFIEKLRIVGLSHIVVISGFHIAVMIKIFQSITISWSKKMAFLLGTIFLICFIILTGGAPSVIRASIMAWLFLLAPILGRKGKITNILALTVLVMILENPLILVYDVSFQLSVLSVLGLIYLMPIFDRIFSRFGEIIGSAISATLAAQIMTLPIIITSFGRVSIVAPITNIIVTPLLPIIIPYGLIIALLSLISMQFTFVVSWPLGLLLSYIVYITDFISNIRFASIEISVSSWFVMVYFLILITILYLFDIYAKRKKIQK